MFTWRATGTANITGFSNNSTPTTILNQTLTNSSYTNGTVTYRILPWIGGCPGDSTSFIVTVFPTADLSNTPAIKQICNNTSTNITLTSNVTGTLFTWTASGSSGQVSGFMNNSTPTVTLDQTLFNTGYIIETVTYRITPIANGCNGTLKDYIVKVAPVPDVLYSPSTPSICSSQQTNIGLGSNVSGATFSWTATASSPTVTGYSDGNGCLIAQTLTTPGIQAESVTYHITPTANGCDGLMVDYTVIINPKPHLTNQPMAQIICSEKTTNINLTASCLNPTYTWTATLFSGNITGFSNGSGAVIAQTLTNLLPTTGQVQYTITPVAVTLHR